MANSVDPDQMRRSASDLGLHCLPMSLLGDARHKWVKVMVQADMIFVFSYMIGLFYNVLLFFFLLFFFGKDSGTNSIILL